MIDFAKFNNFLNFLDVGDIKFFLLIAKKNIKNLIVLSIFISLVVLFISLNLEKKYQSNATIVIAPEENKIVNIEEVYSIESQTNRVNNQIAILKSDEVLAYITDDKKKQLEFERLYAGISVSFLKESKDFDSHHFCASLLLSYSSLL